MVNKKIGHKQVIFINKLISVPLKWDELNN